MRDSPRRLVVVAAPFLTECGVCGTGKGTLVGVKLLDGPLLTIFDLRVDYIPDSGGTGNQGTFDPWTASTASQNYIADGTLDEADGSPDWPGRPRRHWRDSQQHRTHPQERQR